MSRIKTQTIIGVGEDMEKFPHIFLAGMENVTAALEMNMASPQKVKNRVVIYIPQQFHS